MINHRGPISGVATFPGSWVATAGYDNRIILWRDREPVARAFHDHLVNQCAFRYDGKLLVTASSDHTARVWRVPDLRLLAVLGDHEDDVEMAVFDPLGERIATASRDHVVRLFSLDGKVLERLTGHEADVISVCWSADGREVISSSDDGTVRRWRTTDGAQIEIVDLHGVETDTIAVGSRGQLYAGTDDGEIVSIHAGSRKSTLAHGSGIKRLTMNPGRDVLLSCGYDRKLRLWSIGRKDIAPLLIAEMPAIVWARSAAFDEKGRVIVGTFGSSYASFDPNTADWNLAGVTDTHGLNAVLVFDDHVYAVGDAGVVFRDGSALRKLGGLCSFLVAWQGRVLAGGHLGALYDCHTGEVLVEHRSPLNCATVLGNGDLLIGTYTGEGLVVSGTDGRVRSHGTLPLHAQAVKGVASNGDIVFSVCAAGDAAFGELGAMRLIANAHGKIANGVCALRDGRFASVSRDRRLRIWRGEEAEVIASPLARSVKCLCLSRNGNYLALGSYDGSVVFYDLCLGSWVGMQRPTSSGISSLSPGSAPTEVLASSYDGRIYRLRPTGGEVSGV